MSKAEENRFYVHYKGGLYFINKISYDVDKECEVVHYTHVSGKSYIRTRYGFEQPVNKPEYRGERFKMLPGSTKFFHNFS